MLNVFVRIDGRMEKMAELCGGTLPKPLMSNGPRLKLDFQSLYSSSRFNATFSFTKGKVMCLLIIGMITYIER